MLPRLNPDPNVLMDVQQTAFSYDVLGRWACSTWARGQLTTVAIRLTSSSSGRACSAVTSPISSTAGRKYRPSGAGARCRIVSSSHARPEPAAPGFGRPTEQVVTSNAQVTPGRKIWFGDIPGTATKTFRDWPTASGVDRCIGVDGRRA